MRRNAEGPLYFGTCQISTSQWHHRRRFVLRYDPASVSVIDFDAICLRRTDLVDDGGCAVRRLRIDFHRNLLVIGIVSGVGTLRGKARNTGQPRSPADRLNVLIENKTGRILPGNSDLVRINLVRIFEGRAVLYDQTGHSLGPLRPVMAR